MISSRESSADHADGSRRSCSTLCPAHSPNPYRCHGTAIKWLYEHDFSHAQNRFHQAFEDLGKPPHVYLAINSDDSNIVYYKLSPGIVKPPV